ncbi:MAG: response regulator [Anaerostipes hadrus]|nr:response regulator [Anaerostipes hadrus]
MIKTVIVEDDLMVASINSQFAKRNPNIQIVATFHNGKDALDYLKKSDADLVLLDLYMPDCTGLELLSELRNIGSEIDVIMITAANDAEHINEALQLGIVDYLIKPFQYERFAQALDKYLVRKKAIESGVSFTQEEIDRLVNASTPSASTKKAELQKGVQQKTLDKIRVCLSAHPGNYLPCEQIASETGLSRVTIRRYMNFLIEENEVTSMIDYSTGGRPSILYQINC